MLDFSRPIGADNQEQEMYNGLETFDPFADYTQTSMAALYVGSCGGPKVPVINFTGCVSVE